MKDNTTSTDQLDPCDVALEYLQRGWQPVPVPYRQKAPKVKEELKDYCSKCQRLFWGTPPKHRRPAWQKIRWTH